MSIKALTTAEFIEKAKQIHGTKYDYSLVNYKNNKTKIVIICSEHGKWSQVPNSHLNGKGCLICGFISTKNKQSTTLTKEVFISRANSVHNNYYDYSKVNYVNYKTKVIITCTIHGDFEQAPYHHLRNRGCPSCSVTGFDTNKSGILYYLKILGGQAYKIGITNKSVKERFTAAEFLSIEILKVWYYENGLDAYKEEQKILKSFCKNRYVGPGLLKSGNTELFYTDVLNLDYP